jgi:nucleoside 2-deoxyribosyltransferase
MKIYFAGPLFSAAERRFNSDLAGKLENFGHIVFLPQRDGVDSDKPPFAEMSRDARRKALFEVDRDQIFDSDIFLFVLDGRVPDEGACVELGMAYTNKFLANKPSYIIGLQTDIRAAFISSKLNPMLRICFDNIIETEDELIDAINDLK